jgi:hypothetical protein
MYKCPNQTCERNKNGFQDLLKTSSMSSTLECANCEVCLICCACCNKLIENVLNDIVSCKFCGFQIPTDTATRLFLALPSLYPMSDDTIRCIQRSINEKKLVENAYENLQTYKNTMKRYNNDNNRTFETIKKLSELHNKYNTLVNHQIRQLDLLCLKSFQEPRILLSPVDLDSHNISLLFHSENNDNRLNSMSATAAESGDKNNKGQMVTTNIKEFYNNIESILFIREQIKKCILYKKTLFFIDDDENFVNHRQSKYFLNMFQTKQINCYKKKFNVIKKKYCIILDNINTVLKSKYTNVLLHTRNKYENILSNDLTNGTNPKQNGHNDASYSVRKEIDILRKLYITVASVIFMW